MTWPFTISNERVLRIQLVECTHAECDGNHDAGTLVSKSKVPSIWSQIDTPGVVKLNAVRGWSIRYPRLSAWIPNALHLGPVLERLMSEFNKSLTESPCGLAMLEGTVFGCWTCR